MGLIIFLTGCCVILLSAPVLACEPIVPMMILTAPPDAMASILTGKYSGLPTLSFIVLGVVVVFKCILFAWFERGKMSSLKAFTLMFFGNIVSTIVGVITAVMAYSAPAAMFMGLGLAGLCSFPPSMRLSAYLKQEHKREISPITIAFMVPVTMFGSAILFFIAQGSTGGNHFNMGVIALISFWLWKFVAVLAGLSISMFLTTFWEEYVIFKAYRGSHRWHFVPSAARANLYTFLLAGAIGAFLALPQRFQSPNFLIGSLF